MAGGSRYSSGKKLDPIRNDFETIRIVCVIHMKQYYTYISLPITLFKYPYFMITLLNMNISQFKMFLQ